MTNATISTHRDALRTTFFEDGFVGPIVLDAPRARLDDIAARVDSLLTESGPHPLYGRFSVRDWHLLDEEILELFSHPQILETVGAVLGPDLLLWRTKIFAKHPGEGELGWHQEWGAFNGEEIGNDRPALIPSAGAGEGPWNVTIWIALDDVTPDMGPIRFARGSQRRRFPITMKPLMYSEFWHDPFLGVNRPGEIVARANNSSLVLDIDTSNIFQGIDTEALSLDEAKKIVLDALTTEVGAVTLDFDPREHDVIDLPMPAGGFVLFSERVMHGSSGNRSPRRRLAINGRYTRADTQVYPFRHKGERFDGSNLDVSRHECVLFGRDMNGRNAIRRQGGDQSS